MKMAAILYFPFKIHTSISLVHKCVQNLIVSRCSDPHCGLRLTSDLMMSNKCLLDIFSGRVSKDLRGCPNQTVRAQVLPGSSLWRSGAENSRARNRASPVSKAARSESRARPPDPDLERESRHSWPPLTGDGQSGLKCDLGEKNKKQKVNININTNFTFTARVTDSSE